jgi:hypothetical protein
VERELVALVGDDVAGGGHAVSGLVGRRAGHARSARTGEI